ncbi:hypothetical protein [Symbiopectobacterium sp. RP]|uniref:hypothetical protein n=1 Tax=Symbiopectobacterium sp. RP TaxID=3248553 RepID=UPI003D26AA0D
MITANSLICGKKIQLIVIKIMSLGYISLALRQVALSPHPYALVVHDWSHLQFRTHNGKEEHLKMTHGGDVGYEL